MQFPINTDITQGYFEQFNGLAGITTQPYTNNILVCERYNRRVQMLTSENKHVAAIGVTGKCEQVGQFKTPISVCCKPQGDIIVVDWGEDRVQMFDATGRYLGKFGSKGSTIQEFWHSSGISTLDRRVSPSSAASSVLLVTDQYNGRVCVWSTDECRALGKFDVDGWPKSICVDLRGYVHVGGNNNTVETFDPRANFKKCHSIVPQSVFDCVSGLCVDNQNTLIVTDTFREQIHAIQLS